MRLIEWNVGIVLIVTVIIFGCRTSARLSKNSFNVIDS